MVVFSNEYIPISLIRISTIIIVILFAMISQSNADYEVIMIIYLMDIDV